MTDSQNTLPLNMGQWVAPGHFDVRQFEGFAGMTVEQELDLIGPVFVYFDADSAVSRKAEAALKRLKAAGHPLMADKTVAGVLASRQEPDGLRSRYNALMMALVEKHLPGCRAGIDQHGAFFFANGDDDALFAGDASGTFAYYTSATAAKDRIEQSKQLA